MADPTKIDRLLYTTFITLPPNAPKRINHVSAMRETASVEEEIRKIRFGLSQMHGVSVIEVKRKVEAL